jgi:hypothetical protein
MLRRGRSSIDGRREVDAVRGVGVGRDRRHARFGATTRPTSLRVVDGAQLTIP